jgi:hypothetical protein
LIKQEKFSVGISGQGRLMPRFVQLLKAEYPAVIIYDRNEERDSPPSNAPIPRHPEVSDVDAVFSLSSAIETATIRSFKGHKFFNYAADPEQIKPAALGLLVKQMVHSVGELL